jgi:hypothetical protein
MQRHANSTFKALRPLLARIGASGPLNICAPGERLAWGWNQHDSGRLPEYEFLHFSDQTLKSAL